MPNCAQLTTQYNFPSPLPIWPYVLAPPENTPKTAYPEELLTNPVPTLLSSAAVDEIPFSTQFLFCRFIRLVGDLWGLPG